MKINNKKKIKKLKQLFFAVSGIIGVATVTLFIVNQPIAGMAGIGVFALWFLYFQVADYQYIEFSDDDEKITLRYYKAIRIGGTEYNSIEFPQVVLRNAWFENSVFGKKSDLTLFVKTRRGVAEYPSVSLAALSQQERGEMEAAFVRILRN